MVEQSLRARLDALLQEVGATPGTGPLLEEAHGLAELVGIPFTSVLEVVNHAEEALLGARKRPLEAAAVANAPPEKVRRVEAEEEAGGFKPARSAFELFCEEKRAEVQKGLGRTGAAAQSALEDLFRILDPSEREGYNACAAVDKQRAALESLRKGVRSEAMAPRIARRIREAISIMANAPKTARASGLFEGVVTALEELDKRLGPRVRARLGEHLGANIVSREAQAVARRVFGQLNGTRLVMLLLRWRDPQLQSGLPPETEKRRGGGKAGTEIEVAKEPAMNMEEIRRKVSEFLTRVFSKCAANSAADLAKEVEEELFALVGSYPKEYRNRARALTFNLSAADGVLRGRVAAGQLLPRDLVRMDGEELAPDALKAAREEDRRKVLSDIVITEKLPKTKRELAAMAPSHGRRAERMRDGDDAEEDEIPMASQAQGDAAEEAAAEAPVAALEDALAAEAIAEAPANEEDEGRLQEDEENRFLEEAALRLLEETRDDGAIARLLQVLPPTPSSSSSDSSSHEDSEEEWGCLPFKDEPQASAAASSSSSSGAPDPKLQGLLAMGFSLRDAEAALRDAGGNVEEAVASLCSAANAS